MKVFCVLLATISLAGAVTASEDMSIDKGLPSLDNLKSSRCSQKWNEIHLLGIVRPDGTLYAGVRKHDDACGCNQARFFPHNTDINIVLSLLLAAKTSSTSVRIDFLDAADCDSAYRVLLH